MQKRPSARLLVLNREREVLLFRFEIARRNEIFWATPGGGLEDGETYEDAARRELLEEVGLRIDHPGPEVARRQVTFTMPMGEVVDSDERYFVVHGGAHIVSRAGWTDLEREVLADHRWWSRADLAATTEQVWPEDLAAMLVTAGAW